MRRLISLTLGLALGLGLMALPVLPRAAAVPSPVEPSITTLEPEGVDPEALADLREETGSPTPSATSRTTSTEHHGDEPAVLTAPEDTEDFDVVGVTWDATAGQDVRVQVRVREADGWSRWEDLPTVDEGPDANTDEYRQAKSRTGTAPLLTNGADGVQVRVDTVDGSVPPALEVDLIDAGESPADDVSRTVASPYATADAAASQPTIITRKQWGADESLTRGPHHVNQTVKAMILHHTAGSNSYSREGAFSEIRGIYAYHTKSLGWADIGYNLLVDRYGRIFEGRRGSITQAIRGAHAGGFNTDTYGISVMGNFDVATAPQAAVDAVKRATAWKLGQYGTNPQGKALLVSAGGGTARWPSGTAVTINAISGHRNVGQTACPGKYLYPKLGEIRTYAAAHAPGTAPINWPAFPRDWEGDRKADVLASESSGRLWLYRGSGSGGWGRIQPIGAGWQAFDLATVAGDMDGDRLPDVVARKRSTGDLYLYSGNGRGGWSGSRIIGHGWGIMTALVAPGDWDGDGRNDVLAVDTTGRLHFYKNHGQGRLLYNRVVGYGWDTVDLITAVGDVDSRGTPDIVARRKATRELIVYRGNGSGGLNGAYSLGAGWGGFTELIGPGDWDGNGTHDILVRRSDGHLFLYSGNGLGSFSWGREVGRGWNPLRIFG